jgi:hypothetical protein
MPVNPALQDQVIIHHIGIFANEVLVALMGKHTELFPPDGTFCDYTSVISD